MIDFELFDASHVELEVQQKLKELADVCNKHGLPFVAGVLMARVIADDATHKNVFLGGEKLPKGFAPYEHYVLSALMQQKYDIAHDLVEAAQDLTENGM